MWGNVLQCRVSDVLIQLTARDGVIPPPGSQGTEAGTGVGAEGTRVVTVVTLVTVAVAAVAVAHRLRAQRPARRRRRPERGST